MSSFEVDDDGAANHDHSARAVDGDTSSFYGDSCIETEEQSNPWVTVDLGANSDVRYVKIYNWVHPDNWWQRNLEHWNGFGILTATEEAPDTWQLSEGYNRDGDISSTRKMDGATSIFRVEALARYILDDATQEQPATCFPEGHPLHDGCVAYSDPEGEHKLSQEMALVKVMHEGPIACGTGFFCRMKADDYFSGTPGDRLKDNYNSGYCEDLKEENPDGSFPGNFHDPERNDMHCHGSHLDSVYEAVLEDHFHRTYRGTLECCCGERMTDFDAPEGNPSDRDGWVPASNLMHRCDFRGADGNDGNFNFDGGCGGDVLQDAWVDPELFLSPDEYAQQNTCWEMKHFGRQPYFHSGPNPIAVTTETPLASPPYLMPSLDIVSCFTDDENWKGCLLYVTGRSNANLLVLVSTEATDEPRTVDRIDSWDDVVSSCSYVDGVRVGVKDLEYYHLHELDRNGAEANYVLASGYPTGSPVHVQVIDTATCMVSELKSSVIGQAANRRLRHRALL
eukprot:scaffold133731_cov43-Prasinocladus_malaysianus.AAC.3